MVRIISGTKGFDNLILSDGDGGIIYGDDGDDTLTGGAGPDFLEGGVGNDSIYGGDGENVLRGGQGNDTLIGGAGGDVILGDRNNDSVDGGAGDDFINGNMGNDTVLGGAGDDIVRGGKGDDQVFGGAGNDTLYGDLGNNTLTGGAGSDTFVIKDKGGGTDVITDLDFSAGEKIDLRSFANIHSFSDITVVQNGANAILVLPDGQSITLENVSASQVNSSIFIVNDTSGSVGGSTGGGSSGSALNHPPVVAHPMADQTVAANVQFSYQFASNTFEDTDTGDTLSYTASGLNNAALPSWLSFNGNTHIFSGTTTNADAGTFTVSLTATDSHGATATDYFNITVAGDAAPVLSNVGGSTAYVQNAAGTVIDGSATITDIDDTNMEGATLSISAGFQSGDMLNFTNQLGITGNYNAATGVLTLSGSATKAAYETAIGSITFSSNSATTGDRTIDFVVNDGDHNSNAEDVTINYSLAAATLTGHLDDQNVAGNTAANAWTFDASTAFGGTGTYSLSVTDYSGNAVAGYSIDATTGVITNSNTVPNSTTADIFDVSKTGGGVTVHETFDLFTNAGALTGTSTTGADTISGSGRIWGGDGNDSLTTTNTSTVHGGEGNDTITGSNNANVYYGGEGTDSISAGSAADTLYGGDGTDTVDGGSGADLLIGGSGNDYFKFSAISYSTTAGRDTIADFQAGDKINLHNMIFDGFGTEADQLTATYDGTTTIITANTAFGGTTFSFAITGDVTALMTDANLIYSGSGGGTTGNDTIAGLLVYGDDGNDSITLNNHGATINGGAGDDTIINSGNFLNYIVQGGEGNDSINFTGGNAGTILGGNGNDNILDGGAADPIYGGAGDDTLDGAGGADTLTGGSGNDYFRFSSYAHSTTAARDTITDFAAGDKINLHNLFFTGFGTEADQLTATLSGGNTIVTANTAIGGVTFSFQLTGDVTALMIDANLVYSGSYNGTVGNDTITGQSIVYGDAGNDSITLWAHNSTIDGGAGDDTIINNGNLLGYIVTGGAGNDSVDFTGGNAGSIFGASGDDTIIGSGAANNIYGGSGNDSINAAGGNDIVDGGSGDDTINGGAGADSLTGGSGNDYFVFATITDSTTTGRDTITDFQAGDKIDLRSTTMVFNGFGTDSDQLSMTFDGTYTVVTANTQINGLNSTSGNTFSFYIVGDVTGILDNTALIYDATSIGGAGDDTIAGQSSVYGGDGNDSLSVTAGGQTALLLGGEGNDTLAALSWNVDNTVSGGNGDDSLYAGGSTYALLGFGGAGNDTIVGAGVYADTLYGGAGNDSISALGSGSAPAVGDYLYGDAGNDTLLGGAGIDHITGGTGADYFKYTATSDSTTASKDIITDFSQSDGDKIDLSAISNSILWTGNNAFTHTANEAIYYQSGGNTFLDLDTNGDGTADLEIQLTGLISMTYADVVGTIAPATLTGAISDQRVAANTAIGGWTFDTSTSFAGAGTYSLSVTDYSGSPISGFSINSTTGIISDTNAIPNTTTDYIFTVSKTGGGATATDSFDLFIYTGSPTNGTAGNDTLSGANIAGNGGDDSITSSSAATLSGGDGNDTITGNFSGSAQGGSGNDSINPSATGNTINLYGGDGNDTIIDGNNNSDRIYGGDGNDSITGVANRGDTINGGSGDDTIRGNLGAAGADVITGGSGNDYFRFGAIGDSTTTTREIITDFSAGDKINLHNLHFDGFGAEEDQLSVTLSGGNTIVTANTAISGVTFSFQLTGDVTALMTNSNLIYSASNQGTTGADTLTASGNNTGYYADSGNDSFTDTAGSYTGATIFGADGNDTLNIYYFDLASGGAGDDSINSTYDNTIFGGAGNDTVYGGRTSTIYGGSGADSLDGGGGISALYGGSGDDTINGNANADSLTGGTGNDYFRFAGFNESVTTGRDIIYDFASGDIINLHNSPFSGFGTEADQLTATLSGGNTIVTANTAVAGYTFSFQLTGDVTALMTNSNVVITGTNQGTSGADTLTVTAANQGFYGDSGNDVISNTGYTGSTLAGGDGNDTITVYLNGYVNGNAGDDSIISTYDNILFGGDGNDTIAGSRITSAYGGSGNDSITTAGSNDSLSGGSGADTIFGGGGADSIFAGASDGTIDRIIYRTTSDGAAAGANTGQDTISEFEVGTDKIAFTSTLNTNFDDITNDDVITWTSNAAVNFHTTAEALFVSGLADADLTQASFTNVLAAINALGVTAATGDDGIIAVQGATQTAFFLYTENGTAANNIVAAELTLLGITNGQLTTSDFIFA